MCVQRSIATAKTQTAKRPDGESGREHDAADPRALSDLSRRSARPADRPAPFDPASADPRETYRRKCPACGSAKVRVLIPDGENDNTFNAGNFRIFQDRQCKECGRKWTPACPRWAAYFCASVGALLVIGSGSVVGWTVWKYGAGACSWARCGPRSPRWAGASRYATGSAPRGTHGRLTMR